MFTIPFSYFPVAYKQENAFTVFRKNACGEPCFAINA